MTTLLEKVYLMCYTTHMAFHKKNTSIHAVKRYYLYCDECKKDVHAWCITQEWHDHVDGTGYVGHEDYRRTYACPFCGAFIGCRKGTYIPNHGHIPTNAVRKGREFVVNRIKTINEKFSLKRDEIATCLGFSTIAEVKLCTDVEKLRKAYWMGEKLQDEISRLKQLKG